MREITSEEFAARLLRGQTSFSGLRNAHGDIFFSTEALEFLEERKPRLRFRKVQFGLYAPKAMLDGVLVTDSAMGGSDLTGASMRGATFTGTNLWRSELSEASLQKARFHRCDLSYAKAAGASFEEARITESLVHGASLVGASFVRARLERSDLSGCCVAKATFYRASFKGSSLINWDAYETDFRRAGFREVGDHEAPPEQGGDFTGAYGAKWLAKYRSTEWE